MAAAPLSAISAAALAQSALEHEKHVICDAVAELVRDRVPVTSALHFWQEVAKTLEENRGVSRSHVSVRKEYEALKEWRAANRTGKDVDVRKYVKSAARRASRRQASANEKRGGEEEKEDEEEDEDEGEAPSAFTMQLPLPSFGPPSAQAPPAGAAWTSSLPVHQKKQ